MSADEFGWLFRGASEGDAAEYAQHIADGAWTYGAPCHTPAEVAALIAAARREGMERAAAICMGLSNPWIEEASRQADWQREGAAQCERAIHRIIEQEAANAG